MKAGFFNSLIYILVIMLIIPGMTPGMASAIDENLGDHGSLNSGNSTVDNESSHTGDSGTSPDNGSSDSDSDNGSSDSDSGKVDSGTSPDNGSSDSDNGSSDSDSGKVDSGTSPDNGSSDSDNGSSDSDSDSDKVDSGTSPDNVNSDSNSTTSDSDSNKVDTGTTPSNGSSDKSSGTVSSGSRDSGTQNSNNTSSDNESLDNESSDNESSDNENNSSSNYSSSSSGSGMALVSSEPASNIAVKELATRSVIAGYPVKFDFVENSTCITYIEFDPKKTFRRTTATVEELKNTSALVSTSPPGKIYKNVNIWVGEGAGLPTSIRNGLIGFRVEKSWIKGKNVSETLVTLQRYDKEWKSLSTEKVGEDDKYVYFEAETPGYSSFAITEYAGNGNGEEIQGADKIQETLKSLGSEAGIALNKGNSRIKNPMRAARILMAISLPLFMILAGYCVLKKKI